MVFDTVSARSNELMKVLHTPQEHDSNWNEVGVKYCKGISDEIKRSLNAEVQVVSLLKEQQEK